MTVATRSLTAQEIYNEFIAYMKQHNNNSSAWYVGITQDLHQRFFGYHNVSQNGIWINCRAINITHSRTVEKWLLDLGCDGGDGGGDGDAVYVYCYLKTAGTRR